MRLKIAVSVVRFRPWAPFLISTVKSRPYDHGKPRWRLAVPISAAGRMVCCHFCKNGSSSVRRQAQLLHARPDLHIGPIRGNVQTRLLKLRAGECDASLLALAGLRRLGQEVPDADRRLRAHVAGPAAYADRHGRVCGRLVPPDTQSHRLAVRRRVAGADSGRQSAC